ncbi:hypothetical protein PV11_03040 [Exophiala sideris]|uniref:Cyclin N-terminal domain-containing protein n=1 Tax=Exophiala sideris TaxID=1016849 RepID=A0A0D1Z124_9EURO|nr:hypothetical protein PV11_03040 [Exophiala sideris]
MSSMSAVQHRAGSLDWSRTSSREAYDHLSVHGSKSWDKTDNYFTSGLPTPPGSRNMNWGNLGSSYTSSVSDLSQQDRDLPWAGPGTSQQYRESSTTSNGSSYTSMPVSESSLYNRQAAEQNNVTSIAPHLQIPESVNKSKGSLAEFTAEITSLFWFETAETLQYAENLPIDKPTDRGLLSDATPTIGFRKWVTTIISTTQVGKNVVLLALMFIYRLKKFNPTVSGKRGSEFRLLTIALMLGNKFLDDNTYTNKTWAEVSGISVTEIHIMEVEFLSNMRYELYASAEEWNEWKSKLGRFGAFYDKASQLPSVHESKGTTPVTPTSQSFSHKLPSPPSPRHTATPFTRSASSHSEYPTLPQPLPSALQLPNSPLRQQSYASNNHAEPRKRSLDLSAEAPPTKRQQQYPVSVQGAASSATNSHQYLPSSLRIPSMHNNNNYADARLTPTSLDIPRLDISRVQPSIGLPPSQLAPPQLAPLSMPANRAMASVYPATTVAYSHPVTPISAIPQSLFQSPIPNLGDGSRSNSNYPSAHTSPSNGFNTSTPTLPGLSPSYFLTHRTSPYRPVRHVNTLLIPPPSTALQAPVRNVPYDQIHYQPLSKTVSERHTGPLPFMQPDGWQRSNVSTPFAHQQYQF